MKETDIKWLINLRWAAVGGVFAVITAANFVLKIELSLANLYLGNLILFAYNTLFFLYNSRLEASKGSANFAVKTNRFANLQISLDLIMLIYFIYFSGSAENPFIFYFIFHMVIASILLSNRAAYLQATLSMLLMGILMYGQYAGIIRHYHLAGFVSEEVSMQPHYLAGVYSVFVTTLYITVYMATSIVNKMRAGERELEIANKKLEEQDRLKSQYVLTVSHDLQSSLSTIQSCLMVVLSDLTGAVSEKAREMIERAEQRSQCLLRFVKDLLDLSRIRAIKDLEKQRISLPDIVKEVTERLAEKAGKKSLSMSLENSVDGFVFANPDALEEVVANLLTNAIKYTPSGGKIKIRIACPNGGGSMQVSVEDTGIGIPQEDLPHLFKDFYRAENARALEKEGTGLGLSIVKHIMDTHNGKIWVESQAGRGSKFTFALPKEGVKS